MRNTVIAAIAVAGLAACGGGGSSTGAAGSSSGGGSSGPIGNGSGGSGTTASAAQGYYNGRTSAGDDFALVVLDSGEFWTLRLRNGVAYGGTHGSSSTSGANVSGSGSDYDLTSASRRAATLSASYSARASIAGSIGGGASFNASYDAGYETPATLADAAGTWNAVVVSPAGLHGGAISVNADGSLSGFVTNCTYSGSLRPRAAAGAVYAVTLTFAASGCQFNGQTFSGIAALRADGGGRALVIATLPGDASAAFAFAATR